MSVFTVHTIVQRDGLSVAFAPGDELPEWAVGRVGVHCLDDAEPKCKSEPKQADEDAEEDPSGVDFTKPAPARRGRPRKQ